MLEHWSERCSPPWLPEELAVKVRNAFEYGREPVGRAAPELEFSVIESGAAGPHGIGADLVATGAPWDPEFWGLSCEEAPAVIVQAPAPQRRRPPLKMRRPCDFDFRKKPHWLAKGWLFANTAAVLSGQPGAGKSAVAVDLVLSIASGKPWVGGAVKQGAVCYFAVEDSDGIENRFEGAIKERGLDPRALPIRVCSEPLALGGDDQEDVARAIAFARETAQDTGVTVRLIVIDTQAKVTAGIDSSDNGRMALLGKNLQAIRAATGATTLAVSHQSKSGNSPILGAQSQIADARTIITVEKETRIMRVEKQNGGEEGLAICFAIDKVALGRNDEGDLVEVGLVRWLGKPARARKKLSPREEEALTVLQDLTLSGKPAPEDSWRDVYVQRRYELDNKSVRTGRQAFGRLRDTLKKAGFVRIGEDGAMPADN